MPKWWEKARERIGTRSDDPDAVGAERDQAYDQAFADLRAGDPAAAQELVFDRSRQAMQGRPGAEHYRSLAQGHAEKAQGDLHAQFPQPDGADPNHPLFFEIPPTRDAAGMRAHRRVDDPSLGGTGHLHGEYGVVHAHAGGEMPHSHPEAVFERAGFDPQSAAQAHVPLGEAVAKGALAGAAAGTPLAATPAGAGGVAIGAAVGGLTGGLLHYRLGKRREAQRAAGRGGGSNPSPWSILFPALLAAALVVPSDHIDWEYESSFRDLAEPAAVAEANGDGDDPAAGDDPDRDPWDPVAAGGLHRYGGTTRDGQPCALDQDGPALCYHRLPNGDPDLARGPANSLTRGGDVFGIDAEGNPCLLGEPGCRPSPDDPPGLVLPAFQGGGGGFAWDVPWGPPSAPQLGRMPDGRACYVGPDNPACAPVPEGGQAALPPGFEAPPPAELPPVAPIAVPTLEPLAWLEDCPEDDPGQCAGFRFDPIQGLDPLGRGGSPWGRGGDGGGNLDWQEHGWPNPGNITGINVLLPHSSARGCDWKGNPCFRNLAQLKDAAQKMHDLGAPASALFICPAITGFRHTPGNPVLDTQARAAGQRAEEVGLFVETRDGATVTWRPDRHGRIEIVSIEPDPVHAVSARKQLTPATIAWINTGEVQQRFPGKTAQNPDLCFQNRPQAGGLLHRWHPLDPGVHAITEAAVMSESGAVGYWDDGYEFEVALGVASATR